MDSPRLQAEVTGPSVCLPVQLFDCRPCQIQCVCMCVCAYMCVLKCVNMYVAWSVVLCASIVIPAPDVGNRSYHACTLYLA